VRGRGWGMMGLGWPSCWGMRSGLYGGQRGFAMAEACHRPWQVFVRAGTTSGVTLRKGQGGGRWVGVGVPSVPGVLVVPRPTYGGIRGHGV